MVDRPRAGASGGVTRTRHHGTTTAAGVRRNLFQSQLTRRPTASSSASAETLHLDVDVLSDTSEIVVRDKHGEIELGDPPTPVLDDDDDMPVDHGLETESAFQDHEDWNRGLRFHRRATAISRGGETP